MFIKLRCSSPSKASSALIFLAIFFFLGVGVRLVPFVKGYNVQDITQETIHLSNVDGYYYLSCAKSLSSGDIIQHDIKRAYPDRSTRSYFVPLLSILVLTLSFVSRLQMETIGAFLPAVLSTCILIPIFLKARQLGSTTFLIASSIVAVFSSYYVGRTSFGFLDTDCLNVVFPFAIATLLSLYDKPISKNNELTNILAAFSILTILFTLWWDQAPIVVFFFSFSPFVLFLYFQRCSTYFKSLILFFLFSLLFALFYLYFYYDGITPVFKNITSLYSYIKKANIPELANLAKTNSEQASVSGVLVLLLLIPNLPILIASLVGLIIFSLTDYKFLLYLLPLSFIGFLSFFTAERFILFLTPLFFLSFGYFAFALKAYSSRNFISLSFLFIFLSYFCVTTYDLINYNPPAFDKSILEGIKNVSNDIDSKSVIWNWWDDGHPLSFYTDGYIINDGMVHDDYRNFLTSLPMSSSDPYFASNFMKFYITTGTVGIKKLQDELHLTAKGLLNHFKKVFNSNRVRSKIYLDNLENENIHTNIDHKYFSIDYYYPTYQGNLYLFLSSRDISVIRWIHWMATLGEHNINESRVLPTFRMLKKPSTENDNELFNLADIESGTFTFQDTIKNSIAVANISIVDKNGDIKHYQYPTNSQSTTIEFSSDTMELINSKLELTDFGSYSLLINKQSDEVTLTDTKIFNSSIFKLFRVDRQAFPSFFQPLQYKNESVMLWKIL